MASRIGRTYTGSLGGKEITKAPGGSISINKLRSRVISRAASEAAMYSASHINKATIGCLLDPQTISLSLPVNKYPLIDLQVVISPAQSESVYPLMWHSSSSEVVRINCNP
jgi:hypothetical protein